MRDHVTATVFLLLFALLIPPAFAINKTAFTSSPWAIASENSTHERQTGPQPVVVVQVSIDYGSGTNVNSPGYTPDNVTVVLGVNNTVEWVNRDIMAHTVTAVDGSFDSGDMVPNANFTHTFTQAGTYPYLCVYHHWMHGIVIALAPGTAQTQQTQTKSGGPTPGSTTPETYLATAIGVIMLAAVLALELRRTKHKPG